MGSERGIQVGRGLYSEVKRYRGKKYKGKETRNGELLRDYRCPKSQRKEWMTYGVNKTGGRGFPH